MITSDSNNKGRYQWIMNILFTIHEDLYSNELNEICENSYSTLQICEYVKRTHSDFSWVKPIY